MTSEHKIMSMQEMNSVNPFPWTTQVNFDGKGGVRLLDANQAEVPLFSVVGLAQWATVKLTGKVTP